MRKHTKSFVTQKDITTWLSNQKGPEDSAINRNKFISTIINDVETGAFMASEWGDDGFILSVELNNVHSLHEAVNSKKYLVVYEDSSGSIYRGELSLVTPEQDTTSFSQADLPNIINNYNIGFYGTLQYVNFYDYQFAKKQFAGRLKFYEGSWGARVALGENCTHWYLLHIEYNLNTGEVLDYFTVDLGCLTCPPNSLCDEFDGFGGGGGQLDQNEKVDTSVRVKMVGWLDISGYNNWEISSIWEIRGTRNRINPSLSRYTNIDYGDLNDLYFLPGQIVITPNHYYYFYIQSQIAHSHINADGATGTGTIQYICVYPNQNPSNGDNIKVVPGYHVFTSIELN